MSISERCRCNLRTLESSLREGHKPDVMPRLDLSDIFFVNDKKPTPLEELELLNTFATHFPCDDDSKARLFYELFPLDKDITDDRLRFLIKLSSLAICIGLPVILELAAVWLKPVFSFVTGITSDMLSIPGLPDITLSTSSYLTDGDSSDHPFLNLHHMSPAFTEAYLLAATLVYGTSPTFISALDPTHSLHPIGPPPSPVVHCLVNWLQTSRVQPKPHHHSASSHTVSWVSLDWSSILRRFKSCFQTHGYADQLLSCCPPTLFCLTWWTIFIPLDCISVSSFAKLDVQTKEWKSLHAVLGELHLELLLCLADTVGLSTSSGHRHGVGSNSVSSSSGSNTSATTFANWSLSCFRKQQPTKEYHYLEVLVQHILDRCLNPVENQASSCSASELQLKHPSLDVTKELVMTRAVEFLQLAWVSGRFRNLSVDDFTRLLSPLAEHKLIQLVLTRLKR